MTALTGLPLPPELACPDHRELPLSVASPGPEHGELRCPEGCRFPILQGIPRFVPEAGYAASFGLQWNAYRRTQLDSYTGTAISRGRLVRCLGAPLDSLRGLSVLEAGCGAGRFTEPLLEAGARVLAFDLSNAVEANRENCGHLPGHFVCQADVSRVPARRQAFDLVLALGMVQHTPSPEATIGALAECVRAGGLLVLDHYATPASPLRRALTPLLPKSFLRPLFLRTPPAAALRATQALTRALLPLHRLLWRPGRTTRRVRAVWRRLSPVADYYDAFPQLGEHLSEWAYLDTHDGLTDRYKHRRSVEQVADALAIAGLEPLEVRVGGNGVEARARRP